MATPSSSSDHPIEAAKSALRREAQAARRALSAEDRAQASAAAAAHLLGSGLIGPGEVVAAFWPIRDEIDCRPILTALMDGGQPLCLPVVVAEGQPLDLRLWQPGTPLYPSGFGTLAPDALAPCATPDVIIVPLLGFDSLGTRLGYGGGYYDRTIAALVRRPRLIGLAFACQQLAAIPRRDHDVPLDAMVTEAGVTHFQGVQAA